MFVDRVEVRLEAGNGGNGAMSFHHDKFSAKGGPDGGDGGHGGNIILQASNNENTLAAFRYKKLLKAPDGGAGTQAKKHGRTAKDLVVKVPVGTVVSHEGDELADLYEDGMVAIIAKGGKGGFGNAHFVSSTRQAPRVAEKGEKGEMLDAEFELKMIADVGIIGLPNAGKSTLLSVISNAKPEIANYPFTTLHPNLGVVDVDGKNSLLFADIPGLIEGASKGKGLGDEFLRHIERTSVLLHLVDAYSDDVVSDVKTINTELKNYKIDLSGKPQIIAISKIEGIDKKIVAAKLRQLSKSAKKGSCVMAFSALSKEGLEVLLKEAQVAVTKKRILDAKEAEKEPKVPVIGATVDQDAWNVEIVKNKFIVYGVKIERFADRTRFDDYHGQQRFRDIMAKMGITAELEKQGIEPGQIVQIGSDPSTTFEY